MPQSSTIAFALIIAFIIFVTVKGELPTYLAVVGIGNAPLSSASGLRAALTTLGQLAGGSGS